MGQLDQRLRDRFGIEEFYPWQREAILELLDGCRRTLVVAPTGGGKSLCYQFPASELPGTSIVVSPLIALMEDQVRGLTERGIPATWLSSTLLEGERRERLRDITKGRYKLVYIAPERLAMSGMLDILSRLEPPLVAIDEAHCISEWGHDFRPDYLKLREVLERLSPKHVLACTATATPLVREEIVRLLGLPEDETKIVLRGFARPNLHLTVEEIDDSAGRRRLMLNALGHALGSRKKRQGGAIVYAGTRRNSEKTAELISSKGYVVAAYHAGMEPDRRAEVNERFASGELEVITATNAFGMGIDRPDIRAVVHVQAPGSLEEYYQEVGRAGRDGQPAHGLLIASSSDFGLRRRLIEGPSFGRAESAPNRELIDRQWKLFLDLMSYVEAGSCRHDYILRYFGDEGETLGGCGHCDVCEELEDLDGATGVERGSSTEEALVVRKALAGVARAKRRAGLVAVAEMLTGGRTQRLERLGFVDLSTHGILSPRPKDWVLALLRRLMTAGLVDITSDKYPVPFLTPTGWETMKEERPVRVLPPGDHVGQRKKKRPKKPKRSTVAQELDGADTLLFEELRATRSELAGKRGVPAYVVCQDRTLAAMARDRPTTMSQLAEVHGMGPARIASYGERFLAVITATA